MTQIEITESPRSAFSPIEATRLAEAARALEEAKGFCERLFRRYRSELYAASGAIIDKLIHEYPCHSLPIDLEELLDLGLPARPPADQEIAILETIAGMVSKSFDELRHVELAVPDETASSMESSGANGHDQETEAA